MKKCSFEVFFHSINMEVSVKKNIIFMVVLLISLMWACDDEQDSSHCDVNYIYDGTICVEYFSNESNSILIDNITNLMWMNPAVDHLERAAAVSLCENSTMGSYDDWYLPSEAESGIFHKKAKEAGFVPGQLFSYCLAEVTNDGYVKTKKGAEDYGGEPGDSFSFTGAANVRCVRDNSK
jgi:hypothetical protein